MEPTTFGAGEIAFRLAAVLALVFANGFFVAAEFALVTVRKTRIDQLIAEGSSLARPVRRAISEPDSYIAATQLAITMSSLGLGWIGEPAIASMIEPLLNAVPRPAARGDRALDRRRRRLRAHHGAPHRPRRACAEDRRAPARRAHRPRRRAPDRDLHARLLAVHRDAERHRPGRRADAGPEAAERQLDGALRGGAEDARDRQPGSRRPRGGGRADAPPGLRLQRPDGRPGDAAEDRDDGAARSASTRDDLVSTAVAGHPARDPGLRRAPRRHRRAGPHAGPARRWSPAAPRRST